MFIAVLRWFTISELEIVRKVVKDANNAAKLKKTKAKPNKYLALLVRTDITIEAKKALLLKQLHELLITTFSINVKERKVDVLKNNLTLLRILVMKLRDINYYLETIFLEELGLLKINIKLLGRKELRKLSLDEGYLNKTDMIKLEQTVYILIDQLIFSDKKLLKGYKKKEVKAIKEKELGINHLEALLKRESELLCHLESKLPPTDKVKAGLLTSANFTHWVTRIFALLTALESDYQKESKIFAKLKQKEKVRKKLNVKIKHLLKEKERILKLKDARIQSAKNVAKLEKEWFRATHHYTTTSKL